MKVEFGFPPIHLPLLLTSISLCFLSLGFMEFSLPGGYFLNVISGQETLYLLCNLPASFLGLLWFLSWSLSSFHYSFLCGGYSGSRYFRWSFLNRTATPSSVAIDKLLAFGTMVSSTGKATKWKFLFSSELGLSLAGKWEARCRDADVSWKAVIKGMERLWCLSPSPVLCDLVRVTYPC